MEESLLLLFLEEEAVDPPEWRIEVEGGDKASLSSCLMDQWLGEGEEWGGSDCVSSEVSLADLGGLGGVVRMEGAALVMVRSMGRSWGGALLEEESWEGRKWGEERM